MSKGVWTVRTHATREKFLAALAHDASVTAAAAAAGIGRVTAYDWRNADPEFAAAWDEAVQLGLSAAEDELIRRAVHGVRRVVVSHGRVMVDAEGNPIAEHQYSDPLLMFLLKSRRRDIYGDKQDVNLNVTENLAEAMEAARRRARGE